MRISPAMEQKVSRVLDWLLKQMETNPVIADGNADILISELCDALTEILRVGPTWYHLGGLVVARRALGVFFADDETFGLISDLITDMRNMLNTSRVQ